MYQRRKTSNILVREKFVNNYHVFPYNFFLWLKIWCTHHCWSLQLNKIIYMYIIYNHIYKGYNFTNFGIKNINEQWNIFCSWCYSLFWWHHQHMLMFSMLGPLKEFVIWNSTWIVNRIKSYTTLFIVLQINCLFSKWS